MVFLGFSPAFLAETESLEVTDHEFMVLAADRERSGKPSDWWVRRVS